MVQVHSDLGRKHDGALVARIALQRLLDAQNLVTLRGVVQNSAEDLDALSPPEHIVQRNLADIRHSAGVDECIELRHQRQDEVTILKTVLGNRRTVGWSSLVHPKEVVRLHIVLGEGPLQRGPLLVRELGEQIGRGCDAEGLGSHLCHDELLSLAIGVRRISHDIKPNVVSDPKPSRALGLHLPCRVAEDLVAQEDRGDIVELEAVQRMLTAHIQEQVQSESAPQRHVSQIVLARGQLKLLGLKGLLSKLGHLAGEVQGNPELLRAHLQIRVIKPKGVVAAEDIRVHLRDLRDELLQERLLRRTRDVLHVLLLGLVYRADDEDHAA